MNMIEAEHRPNAVVVKMLTDEFEMYKVPEFKAAITSYLETKPGTVVLDMEKVELIDSSAIGALFYFNKQVKSYGGKLILVQIGEQVDQILHATQSMGLLNVMTSTEDAIASAPTSAP
jgi:anti-sigma B factor antagonist